MGWKEKKKKVGRWIEEREGMEEWDGSWLMGAKHDFSARAGVASLPCQRVNARTRILGPDTLLQAIKDTSK